MNDRNDTVMVTGLNETQKEIESKQKMEANETQKEIESMMVTELNDWMVENDTIKGPLSPAKINKFNYLLGGALYRAPPNK